MTLFFKSNAIKNTLNALQIVSKANADQDFESARFWRVFFRWVHDLDIDDEDPISFPEKSPSCASPSCTFYCYMNSKTERNLFLYIDL